MPFYHNFLSAVYYHFFNVSDNLTEWNISTTGRKELTEGGALLFIGGRVLRSLDKRLFCLVCNILYHMKLILTNFSLYVLFIMFHHFDSSRCPALCKIRDLLRVPLNLLFICRICNIVFVHIVIQLAIDRIKNIFLSCVHPSVFISSQAILEASLE